MSAANKGHLRITSSVDGTAAVIQQVPCDVYRRGPAVYYRYIEPAAEQGDGETRATIKAEHNHITIIRHGAVESKQEFRLAAPYRSYYRSAGVELLIETNTTTVAVHLTDGFGSIQWAYELYVEGELTGRYQLEIIVTEV